jgi:antirestriction protein ArdC
MNTKAKKPAAKKAKPSAVKVDIRQTVTDRIIKMLEDGGNQASKRWTKSAAGGFPVNGKTGAFYQGVNVLILWGEMMEKAYKFPVWLTFNQAAEMGANVKKGEHGTQCVYFEMLKKRGEDGANEQPDSGEAKAEFFPMCKAFYVFNADQIENLPQTFIDKYMTGTTTNAPKFNAIEEAERILTNSGASIRHQGNKAFYSPSCDYIALPEREAFVTPEDYYATALHELTHWTGHASRLARDFSGRFGSEAYAFEELIAELGAAFVVGSLGFIDATIVNHASYLESWLKVLRNDKTAIFTACKHAWLASDFIFGTEKGLEMAAA